MKEITTSKGVFLFIQCPSDIKKYWIHFDASSGRTKVANDSKIGWTVWQHVLEDGLAIDKYEIISTTKEITEELAESIIPSKQTLSGVIYPHYPLLNDPSGYYNEEHWASICETAIESLQTLKQVNKLKQPNYLILKKL